MGVSAPVVCLQDVLSNALSDGDLQLDDQHVAADRLQSAAVGELESAGESSGKGEKQDEAEDCWVLCSWVAAREVTIRSRSRPTLVHALQDPD